MFAQNSFVGKSVPDISSALPPDHTVTISMLTIKLTAHFECRCRINPYTPSESVADAEIKRGNM